MSETPLNWAEVAVQVAKQNLSYLLCKNYDEVTTMVAGTATLKLSLSAFSSPMSNFSASSSFPSRLPMRTPSSSKPRFLSESLRSLISTLSLTTLRFSLTCAFLSGIYALTSNDIKVGTNLEVDGAPWRVLGFFFTARMNFGFSFEL